MKQIKLFASLLFLCLFTIGFIGCDDSNKEASPILVFLSPTGTQIEANSNDRVFITVDASTSLGNSISMNIQSIDDVFGIQTLLDSTFAGKAFTYRFEYIVPQYPDSTETLLVFNLADDINNKIEIAKKILINKGSSQVTERTGVTLFSSASDKPNAYSLATLSPGFLADSATFEADIVDDTTAVSDQLSRTWISNTGVNYVQFNGFNYAGANSLSIQNAYDNGVKLSKVSEIQDSDVLLIGRGSTALGAVQVIAVTDQSGTQDDKYTFSIKVIDN